VTSSSGGASPGGTALGPLPRRTSMAVRRAIKPPPLGLNGGGSPSDGAVADLAPEERPGGDAGSGLGHDGGRPMVHVGGGRSLLAATARASGCGGDVLLRMRRRRPPHDPMMAPQDPAAAASSGSDDGSSRSQDSTASGLCGLRISGTEREGVCGGGRFAKNPAAQMASVGGCICKMHASHRSLNRWPIFALCICAPRRAYA
jgi:hypothetical protein